MLYIIEEAVLVFPWAPVDHPARKDIELIACIQQYRASEDAGGCPGKYQQRFEMLCKERYPDIATSAEGSICCLKVANVPAGYTVVPRYYAEYYDEVVRRA